MSYRDYEFWCAVIVLVVALGHLAQLPSWWRGPWRGRWSRWRDRSWLVTVLAVITFCTATVLLAVLEIEQIETMGWWRTGMALYLVGALLVLLIPLIGGWHRLDFAVPRRLRTPAGAPERWAEARTLVHGNRQERRSKARSRR